MKLPPSLSDILMRNFVEKVKYAPLIFIFNGWWMISNEEIFHNKWDWIDHSSASMTSNHTVRLNIHFNMKENNHVSHAAPIQIVAFISIFLLIM